MAVEVLSLGTVSKMFRLAADEDVRHRIAKGFGYPHSRFAESTFHSLTVLRNTVAHHGRIWHQADIQYAPPVLNRLKSDPDESVYQRTPWAWMTVLADLVDRIRHDNVYSTKLFTYANQHPRYLAGLKHPVG